MKTKKWQKKLARADKRAWIRALEILKNPERFAAMRKVLIKDCTIEINIGTVKGGMSL